MRALHGSTLEHSLAMEELYQRSEGQTLKFPNHASVD